MKKISNVVPLGQSVASRAQLVNELVDCICADSRTYHDLAAVSEVSPTTLHNWVVGKTMYPRIDTLLKVANALGYTITLTRIVSSKKTAQG